jgi:6-pyruvoyltetrahydropterin/6-carboxytetrahydropterin synthase
MLIDIATQIKTHLPENVELHHLRLQETATSYAEWFAEDNKI